MAILLIPLASLAAEKGSVIRTGDLMAEPFIDAAKTGPLTAQQPVTILKRQGGWVQVEANGQTGWVRTLNVRLDAASTPAAGGQPVADARPASSRPSLNPASLLGTGSSGKTVTTGVKGLEEEDIKNATVNYAELAQLNTLGVADAEARTNAEQSKLKENRVEYLKERK